MTNGSYIAMRPSGINWVGDIPEHWEVEKAKWLFMKMERGVRDDDDVVTCFRDGVVTLRKNRRTTGFTESLKEIGYQGIRQGDLVIHAMDGFAGAIGVSDSDGKGTPVYSVCKPKPHADAYFYAYVLREMARSGWIHALAKGIRERSTDFRYSSFAEQHLPIPPLAEQRAIARYLNYVDDRIQRYIRAKERLIELLEEQKRAVINQMVTRGLDPDVPLKPSGVEWLGDIPAHWEVVALKRLGRFKSGAGFPIDQQGHSDEEFPFLKVSDMNLAGNEKFMHSWNNSVSQNTVKALKAPIFPTGAIVFPKVGGAMLTNKRRVLTRRSCIDNNLMACVVNSADPDFVFLLLRHLDFASITKPGPVPAVSEREVSEIRIAYPPSLNEQRVIVGRVDVATTNIDTAVASIRAQIELIKEYRTRLIADVVTGKLDVRDAAANLPDGVEEDELSDRSCDPNRLELAEVR